MTKPQVLISAGEASGDMYAARLAAALRARADVHLFGLGGPQMREAGVELVADSSEVAVLGITEVLHRLPALRRVMRRLVAEAARRRPTLAILTDFPGFHLRLARRLRLQGVRNVYFVAPQFWAWRPWRARLVRRRFERALCIFPFEEKFYRDAGVTVDFIGHPLVDQVQPVTSLEEFRAKHETLAARHGLDSYREILALLPGSRPGEIAYNLPPILQACQLLDRAHPGRLQFVLAVAPGLKTGEVADFARSEVALHMVEDDTYGVLAAADVSIIASGTATVEGALAGAPMVVVYRVSPVTAFLARRLVRAPFFGMPNLIAGRRVVPELIQNDFTPERLAAEVTRLLDPPEEREQMKRNLAEVRSKLGPGGAIERAADIIARML
jgi:lipid-A-disaccharide synthase